MHPVGSYCTDTYPPTCIGQLCYNPTIFIIKHTRIHLCTFFGSVALSNCSKYGHGLFKTEKFLCLLNRASF